MVSTLLKEAGLVILLFANSICFLTAQNAKVALINLDSLKANSVLADWTSEFWKELELEQDILEKLKRKYLQAQQLLEAGPCNGTDKFEAKHRGIIASVEEIKRFERKVEVIKKMILMEIGQFVLQQIMKRNLLIRTEFQTEVFSTELPIFIAVRGESQMVFITDWFIRLIEKDPHIRLDWELLKEGLSRRIAIGQW